MDERNDFQDDSPKNEEKLPHLKELINRESLTEIGKRGLTPFVQILHRYKDEVTPYIEAIKTGCDAAARELSSEQLESSRAKNNVSSWFQGASRFLEESNHKLNQNEATMFMDFIKDESRRRPVMMFSASYLLGVFAGRLGKKQINENKTSSLH